MEQTSKETLAENLKVGNITMKFTNVGVYAFETVASTQNIASPSVLPFYTRCTALLPLHIGMFKIVPFGEENKYPEELRVILDDDNFLPQGLKKDYGLIWGQGPALYKTTFKDGRRYKEFVDDPEIMAWLESWDYIGYLMKATTDYTTINGHFTKYFRNRGTRIGKKAIISKLEHSSNLFSRLEWPDVESDYQIHNIIVGDYRQPWKYGLTAYPVFDPSNPFANAVSMRYSNLYYFSLDHEYSRAPFHGALNWIKLASSIPKLLSSFNSNAAAIKYHIQSPAEYWEAKKLLLQEDCERKGIPYTDKMLEVFKDKTFETICNALSGIEKVGKIVTTDTFWSELGNEMTGWKIEVLDQKVKDFIDAQINIASEASFQVSSGIGLHPALSNLSKDGNLPSGSEQLYAFKLYLMTSIEIPEGIIMKDMNYAINANFPGRGLKLGFYHDNVLTEEATNPKDRVVSSVPAKSLPTSTND